MSTETIKQKFYGWRMIVGANLVDFFSAGLAFYAYAVFFGFIQEEFSASRFLVSLTVSMTILAAGIYSPLLGYILDKFPIKKVLTIGALNFGFGFIEVGTITLEPQKGNPKPRIFRFPHDKTLVNSLGFNNSGSVKALANIKKNKKKFDGILGVSIGKSKNTKTKNAWQDYLHLMDYFFVVADYLAINISSPNTENLRELSSDENLEF